MIWAVSGFHAGPEVARAISAFEKRRSSILVNWNLEMLFFVKLEKPENQDENLRLEQGENELQTQPTCGTGWNVFVYLRYHLLIWCPLPQVGWVCSESNPGHIGGRRALSLVRQPFSVFTKVRAPNLRCYITWELEHGKDTCSFN